MKRLLQRLGGKRGGSWVAAGEAERLKRRTYTTYDEYVAHQRGKLAHKDLSEYDVKYREALRERLSSLECIRPGATVLCLAARIGTEVKAFIDHGCFAIGIDLNPGEGNRYVVHGDFHDLQYAEGSIDVVFTNSLDHAYEVERIIAEVRRVLKPEGHLIVEAVIGSEDGKDPGEYESFWWSRVDDLVALFEREGFAVRSRAKFRYPWRGEQLCFQVGGRVTGVPDRVRVETSA
jgi:SAM-dependent methyltransferase